LFYGKYPYKILFLKKVTVGDPNYHQGWTVHNCKQWLDENNIENRMYNRIKYRGKKKNPKTMVNVTGSLFLSSKDDFDNAVLKWKNDIDSVVVPYDQSHVDVLKNNTTILIRSSYLYGRYRYVVTFSKKWNESIDDLGDWVRKSFRDKLGSSKNDSPSVKYQITGWFPRLYLVDEDDLVLTKLTWGDRIRDITVVCTIDELDASKKAVP
jgi:hypothetical protein